MIKQVAIQEQDLWEAWVEFDQFSTTHFGMLYVSGELSNYGSPQVSKFTRETEHGTQLVIELIEGLNGRQKLEEFFYSEPIQLPLQYNSIIVLSAGEEIAFFDSIEIVI